MGIVIAGTDCSPEVIIVFQSTMMCDLGRMKAHAHTQRDTVMIDFAAARFHGNQKSFAIHTLIESSVRMQIA